MLRRVGGLDQPPPSKSAARQHGVRPVLPLPLPYMYFPFHPPREPVPSLRLLVCAFDRPCSRSIHSWIYGEHCSTEMPSALHALRKRMPSTSTRCTSSKSNPTGPPRLISAF